VGCNGKFMIPCPILWGNAPVQLSNLDSSRTYWEGRKVVFDVLIENGGNHMRNIGGKYVPAERG